MSELVLGLSVATVVDLSPLENEWASLQTSQDRVEGTVVAVESLVL